jgi:uroporphyrinogen decarboxylase
MTGRDRVLESLSFRAPDRVPLDLGGMRSTGISAFAYGGLRAALGLPARLPRLYDTIQMLALPELDLLDALECDIVHVTMAELTNAFDEPERWKRYDHNGRLPALVRDPDSYRLLADGCIVQRAGGVGIFMPRGSTVFDADHAGEMLDLQSELVEPDWEAVQRSCADEAYTDERVRTIRDYCLRVRSSTDRAVFLNGLQAPMGFDGGMAQNSMICLLHPEWAREQHRIIADHMVRQVESLLPEIRESIDVIMFAADDQGTQNGPLLPPTLFREVYVPYYRRMTDAIHRAAPGVKVFLHSCGAIFELIPAVIDAGFDVLNPVQWSAGRHSYREWKEAARGRISLWGGGVDTQHTLPLRSVEEVEREVADVVRVMGSGGGYVFSAIHNILAEIDPRKVVAMYRVAAGAKPPLP